MGVFLKQKIMTACHRRGYVGVKESFMLVALAHEVHEVLKYEKRKIFSRAKK